MIDADEYKKIRQSKIKGISQRQTARELGISRDTVAKYWNGGHIPGDYEPREHKDSEDKAEIKDAIRKYCEEQLENQNQKQKIKAHIIWRDLHHKYPRSESMYRRYVAEIRGEKQEETRMPLEFGAAEAAEVDWKLATIRIRGVKFVVHVLCVTLMYGYTPFMKAYPNEKQYNLMDGLVSAIDAWGGTPGKFFMDNMVTARKKGYGKSAELTDEFKMFTAHYGATVEFANIYEPAEKGGVEVAAKTAGTILTPIMDVDDISMVNDRLLNECRYYIEHSGRIGNRPRTVKEMTAEEKPFLIPPPIKRYELGIHDTASVDNRQLFKFDGHVYSAPRPYARKEIGIISYAFQVKMYYKGRQIWECGRPILENENRVYAEHYLYDLKVKPRSRENSFPLLEGVLPPPLQAFRALCKSRTSKCYQLYMLMRKMEEVGAQRLFKAVEIANAAGNPTYQMVEETLAVWDSAVVVDEPDKSLLDDEFYVEQRDPSEFDMLWGR
jgi:transposase